MVNPTKVGATNGGFGTKVSSLEIGTKIHVLKIGDTETVKPTNPDGTPRIDPRTKEPMEFESITVEDRDLGTLVATEMGIRPKFEEVRDAGNREFSPEDPCTWRVCEYKDSFGNMRKSIEPCD